MKTNTLFLLLMLVVSTLFAQKTEVKKVLLFTENFIGDTVDPLIVNRLNSERRTPTFDGLTLLANGLFEVDYTLLKSRYLHNPYDSIELEVSFAHRYIPNIPGLNNRAGFYRNFNIPVKEWRYNDGDTHVVSIVYKHYEHLVFGISDTSWRAYINHLKVYGYKTDTLPNDTPTTGISEDLYSFMKIYNSNDLVIVDNSSNHPINITIRSINGFPLIAKSTSEKHVELPVSLSGIYIVLIEDDKGRTAIRKVFIYK